MGRMTVACVWGIGVATLAGCPDLGYVYTDPDPTNPGTNPDPPGDAGNPSIETTEAMPTTGAMTVEEPPDPSFPATTIVTTEPSPTTGGPDTGDTDTGTDVSTTGLEPAVCGNGVVEDSEQCDDGNQDAGDGCELDCTTTPLCGDGVVAGGEQCDDGNQDPTDGCEPDCTLTPFCGDGVVTGGEQCDDGNFDAGDGCEPNCTFTATCGNGVVEGLEACDDGNTDGGDGCEADCSLPCQAPVDYAVCDAGLDLADKLETTNAHRALGVCDDLPDNSVVLADYSLQAADGASWQVARGFGTFAHDADADPNTPDTLLYAPREGDTLLVLSTGKIAAPGPDGVVVEASNSQFTSDGNDNLDGVGLLFDPAFGSNDGAGGTPFRHCDGVRDCSDTLQAMWQLAPVANDELTLSFVAQVPAAVHGWSLDLVFCSAEWPSKLNAPDGDVLVVWQTDPSADDPSQDPPVDPYTGNLAYLPDPFDPAKGRPLSVTTLHPHFLGPGFVNAEPQLAGTGFEQHACSNWLTVRGGVQPGADVTVALQLADRGDDARATVVLVDNFRWDCAGCLPAAVDECGVAVAP